MAGFAARPYHHLMIKIRWFLQRLRYRQRRTAASLITANSNSRTLSRSLSLSPGSLFVVVAFALPRQSRRCSSHAPAFSISFLFHARVNQFAI
ncbi:hypothetical protein KCP76_03850 [Salmonella enterica subsp. enterica serovar Weltevreden]|nr:hypothetical protein KCP76_03850 [Salmonella enterica subsp. enterica serovar Weltevreden]